MCVRLSSKEKGECKCSFGIKIPKLHDKKEFLNPHMKIIDSQSIKNEASDVKFRKFFEEGLSGDFISDGEGKILDCNRSFLEIYGYDSKDEIIGKDITIVYINKKEFDFIKERLKKEKKIKNLEGERVKKDGTIITVLVNLAATQNQLGEIVEIKGFLFDISERKRLEQELTIAKEKAEESDRLKSAFLANISHEIRTPMNAIVGFASFLKNKNKSKEEIDKYADIIIKSSNHLLSLINDIVDISKIDANKVNVVYTQLNLNKLLTDLLMFFHSQLVAKQKNNLNIFFKKPAEDFIVSTDETRLRQILVNIIGNAIKFTSEGFVEFGYQIKNEKILFFVKDSGIGIPKEKHEMIFDRFSQAADSSEKLFGGTGLGLSISKACVEMLGGQIWLESEVGKGSTFYFTIDFIPVETPIEEQKKFAVDTIKFNGEQILIADDDEINYLYLMEIFKNYDLQIKRTKKGYETINFVINNPGIKLILMDIQMPEMNGWEVTRQLRKLNYKMPIIAHTAYAFNSDKIESLNAGCDYFLPKPTRPKDLVSIVHKFMYKE